MATQKKSATPAKTETAAVETETETVEATAKRQGTAVVLKNGERRIDYIHRRYYDEGIERGPIAKELTELQGEKVAYQIVFAATKKSREEWAAEKAKAAK